MEIYGPNDNRPLDRNRTVGFSVPKGYRAEFRFEKEATWAESICIYRNENNNLEPVIKKFANHPAGDLNNWDTPYNHSEESAQYIISGWYWHDRRWIQCKPKKSTNSDNNTVVGFNDGFQDEDYNDIVAIYKLTHEEH